MLRVTFIGMCLAAVGTPALAQVTPPAPPASATSFSVTSGVDFSSGKYGLAANTDILVVPIVGRLTTGDFAFTASMPYIHLKTPGGVVLGPDGTPIPGVPSAGGTTSGFGDLNVGAKYNVPSTLVGEDFDLTFGGSVKLPTADASKGLSTGKTDYGATVEAGYTFGNVSPFVELGYRWLGDPSTVDLRDGPTASVGTSVTFGKSSLIASYDYARSAIATVPDSHELFAGLTAPVGSRLTLTGYGTKGLSQGAPDYGLGLLLTVKAF